MRRTWLAIAIAIALASCRRLPELLEDTCGNGVIEPNEDCDRFPEEGPIQCGNDCRYLCDFEGMKQPPLACPAGRSCGRDNLCRLPSGAYALTAESPFPLETTELSIADLDGDRIEDLAGGTPDFIDVRYGVGDGTYRESFSIAIDLPRGGRTLGDITGDGTQDLLVPYLLGVSPFFGDRSRSLLPHAHLELELGAYFDTARASDTRFLVGRRTPDFDSTATFAVWTDGRTLRFIFDVETSSVVSVPATGDRLTTARVADLTEGSDTDELIVAIEGEPHVWLGRIRGTILLEPVRLGGFGELTGEPIHLADFDDDGRLDLLLLSENDSGRHAVVIRGDGTSFAQLREELRLSECFVAEEDCWPLAVAVQDGLPLFVLPEVVLTSSEPDGPLAALHLNHPIAWTDAVVGDFNRDGALDIAGIDGLAASVALLYRSGDAFNRIEVPLPAVPRQLAAGDFDGDGVGDLACVLEREGDEIHVVFGETSGPPGDAIFMAGFPRVARVEPTFFRSPVPWNSDRINDLIVELSPSRDQYSDSASILIGTGRRRMHAPIPLVGADGTFGTPYLVRAGELDRTPGALDLMALTLQGELWILANRGADRFSPEGTIHLPVPCGLSEEDLRRSCATLELGDIVPSNDTVIEEAVLADRSAGCPLRSDPVRLGLLSFANDAWSCTALDTSRLFPGRTDLRRMKLSDVDGDGRPDLILAAGGDAPAVFVAFGDPSAPFQIVVEIGLNTAQPIDLAAVEGAQLAILTDGGLAVAKFDPALRTLVSLEMVGSDVTGSHVLASKVDPDGLEDLLVGDRDRIYIFEAQEGFTGGTRVEP